MEKTIVECKSYERPWRDLAVDRNLDDHWLEQLNNLEALDLVSICEGHIDIKPTSVRRSPRIALMLKKAYMRPLTERWYNLKEALAVEIEKIWHDEETIVEFEILHRLVKNGAPLTDIEAIIIRITSERKRDTMLLPEWTTHWFRQTLLRIETFDWFMQNMMIIKERSNDPVPVVRNVCCPEYF